MLVRLRAKLAVRLGESLVGPALGWRSGALVPAALDFVWNLFRR